MMAGERLGSFENVGVDIEGGAHGEEGELAAMGTKMLARI